MAGWLEEAGVGHEPEKSHNKPMGQLFNSVFVLSCLSTGQYTEEGDRAAHSGEEGAAGGTASEERR